MRPSPSRLVGGLSLGVLLALAPSPALAVTCTCDAGRTCDLSGPDGDWSQPECQGGLDASDDLLITIGGHLRLNGSNTVHSIVLQDGAFMDCRHDGTPVAVTVDGTIQGPGVWPVWLWADAGSTTNCAGATGSEGEDITFTYSGTTPAWGAVFLVGRNVVYGYDPTTDAIFNLRGLKRGSMVVARVEQGANTRDFVFCANMIATSQGGPSDAPRDADMGCRRGVCNRSTMVPGDTAWFTSGSLKEYPCEVVPQTEECADACSGRACDVQMDCNSTGRDYLDMVKVPGNGGPMRHPTPEDSDADGEADNGILRPSPGDAVEVFKPFVIQGGSAPILNGARFLMGGVQANMRYGILRNLTDDSGPDDCTALNCAGGTPIHFEIIQPTAPEGDLAFINIHDFVGVQAIEFNATDHLEDGETRANRPATYRHFYIHDPDPHIASDDGSHGGPCTCSRSREGGGVALTVDNGDEMTVDGLTLEDFHYARLYNDAFEALGPQTPDTTGPQWTRVTLRDTLIHDLPADPIYHWRRVGGMQLADAVDTLIDGLACWDVGRSGGDGQCLALTPTALNVRGSPPNGIRARNLYAVNVDANETSVPIVDMAYLVPPPYTVDSSVNQVTDAYFANNVGLATQGGAVAYSAFLNDAIDDDGSPPCPDARRTIAFSPVDWIGNLIARTVPTSCYNDGILFGEIGKADSGGYSTRTRRVVSNVITGMQVDPIRSTHEIAGVSYDATHTAIGPDVDVLSNLIDAQLAPNAPGQTEEGILYRNLAATAAGRMTVRSNLIANQRDWGILNIPGLSTFDSGFNVFSLVGGGSQSAADAAYAEGGLRTGDVMARRQDSSRQQPLSRLFTFGCGSRRVAGAAGGTRVGPQGFGIQSFGLFHPAVIRTMDPLVFRTRAEQRDCPGSGGAP